MGWWPNGQTRCTVLAANVGLTPSRGWVRDRFSTCRPALAQTWRCLRNLHLVKLHKDWCTPAFFRWDYRPRSPMCIRMQKDHMRCSPCQEFGGLWKPPNNPPCANTNSITVFTLLKLDTISIWQKKKKILLIREHMAYCQWYRNAQISHQGSIIIVAVPKGSRRSTWDR